MLMFSGLNCCSLSWAAIAFSLAALTEPFFGGSAGGAAAGPSGHAGDGDVSPARS